MIELKFGLNSLVLEVFFSSGAQCVCFVMFAGVELYITTEVPISGSVVTVSLGDLANLCEDFILMLVNTSC